MLPEKSQGKVLQATVVAVGPGSVNQVITCSRPYFQAVFSKNMKYGFCNFIVAICVNFV